MKEPKIKILIAGGIFVMLLVIATIIVVAYRIANAPDKIVKTDITEIKKTDIKKTEVKIPQKKWKIEITSNSGSMKFSGSYFIVTPGGSEQKSIDGDTPQTIEFDEGTIVSCSFQKKSKSGNLQAEIYKNGKLEKSSSTDAEYGLVTVATK